LNPKARLTNKEESRGRCRVTGVVGRAIEGKV